ncbi:MAG: PAS domain S-box protein [Tychonema bourrellyi B0820]|uniref:histidine kinase n=1 Tax=Tychonema bourrellyi FEM_GT703 TaxID=2040638 RepID=A0A2G4F2L7_9CYAN|nr:PAS domain-containing sensor histidine kinase [Tychonema bourrellyi]MDQ2100762.1 PAS domain S-box protein [Tychonema bourrellyi B0820]PHX55996.1 PAS domain-containing sensor histidine kinase [Tychonema bourrellyi FEM_GT703]
MFWNFLNNLLFTANYIPHGHCYLWQRELVGLHIVSDSAIALSYYSIPLSLLYFVFQRKDLPFRNIFWLFGAFILSCGTTHVMEVWTLWHPVYWLSGSLKLMTALISAYTALALIPLIPQALTLPSPTHLQTINQILQTEIAERQKIAITLLELTQVQNAILNSANYTIISTDADGIIKTFNLAAQQLLGYSLEEVVGKLTPEIIHDPLEMEQRSEVLSQELGVKIKPGFEVFVALARRGIADENEWTYIRKDGSRFPVLLSVTALYDSEANINGFLGIAQDISDRKQAEKELRELNTAMQNAVEGISRLDIEGRYVNVNRAYAHKFGYEPEEMIGMEWKPILHPDDVEMLSLAYQEMLTLGKVEVEARGVRKNGSFFYKQITMVKACDKKGIFNGYHCFMKDITERKLTERALQESESKYRQIVELAEEGIWVIDSNARTTYVNHAMARMLGYTESEMFGESLFDFMDEEAKKLANDNIDRRKQGITERHEFRLKSKDGKDVWTYMSTSPVMDEKGDLLSCCALVYNITERKDSEQQMLQLTTDLKRSNQELEQFAYVASHDLQEPLRAVTSYTQLLAQRYQGNLDTKADKYINYVVDGASRMQQLINDLLAYSRLGTRAQEFDIADCNAAVAQSLCNLQIAIAEKNAIITYESLPTVMADEFQLVQLFQNLIGNAIKFCQDVPIIHISAIIQDNEWLFSVRDNGIGIDSEYADRIFVIFGRLHSRREYLGTGIGLAMCKRIVERHSGRIWVESQSGEGATFYFTIPIVNSCSIKV